MQQKGPTVNSYNSWAFDELSLLTGVTWREVSDIEILHANIYSMLDIAIEPIIIFIFHEYIGPSRLGKIEMHSN